MISRFSVGYLANAQGHRWVVLKDGETFAGPFKRIHEAGAIRDKMREEEANGRVT